MNTTMLGTLVALALLAGCERKEAAADPARHAGRELDQAGARVPRQVQGELARADRATGEARGKFKRETRGARGDLKRAAGDIGNRLEDAAGKIRDVVD